MDSHPSTGPAPPPTVRFAPSPNGFLHLGHAYSALLNRRLAGRLGARLLLRFEDIDPLRCREEFAAAIEDDLSWLGLDWERPVRRQSAHLPAYAAAIDGLVARRLAYPCFCTRGLIAAAARPAAAADPDGAPLYPGLCRLLSDADRRRRIDLGQPYAWRLDMAAALDHVHVFGSHRSNAMDGIDCNTLEQDAARKPVPAFRHHAPGLDAAPLDFVECGEDAGAGRRVPAEPARWGDVLIARKDVPTSYHVSVVLDDAAQGVTDVVRGLDLFAATSVHRLLQRLFGLPAPRYHHHRLILDEAGQKLSKRHQARSLRSLRREGASPEEVGASLGFRE